MSVKIKLTRKGPRKKPFFRIVAIDKRKKLTASPLAILGYFDPKKNELKIKRDSLRKLISEGAQVSTSVAKLIAKGSKHA